MSQTIDARVSGLLQAGEKVLWTGRSKRGFMFHPTSVLLIVCILLVAGLVIGLVALNNMKHSILIIEIITEAARQRFTTIGIFSGLFILLGLIALWGFVFYPLQRRKTVYAITDNRALVVSGLLFPRTVIYPLGEINFKALTRPSRGKATVIFGRYPDEYAEMDGRETKRVMDTWKWFGYRFDEFEIGLPRAGGGKESRRPVFGRFEQVDDPRQRLRDAGAGGCDKVTGGDGCSESQETRHNIVRRHDCH